MRTYHIVCHGTSLIDKKEGVRLNIGACRVICLFPKDGDCLSCAIGGELAECSNGQQTKGMIANMQQGDNPRVEAFSRSDCNL